MTRKIIYADELLEWIEVRQINHASLIEKLNSMPAATPQGDLIDRGDVIISEHISDAETRDAREKAILIKHDINSMPAAQSSVLSEVNLNIPEQMKDKGFRDAFNATRTQDELATRLRNLREAKGLTQTQLADLCGMKQSAISRLEDADYDSWNYSTLTRLASALDAKVSVSFTAQSSGDVGEQEYPFYVLDKHLQPVKQAPVKPTLQEMIESEYTQMLKGQRELFRRIATDIDELKRRA